MKPGLYVNVEDAANLASEVLGSQSRELEAFLDLLKDASPLYVTDSGNIIRKKDS